MSTWLDSPDTIGVSNDGGDADSAISYAQSAVEILSFYQVERTLTRNDHWVFRLDSLNGGCWFEL